MKIFRLLPFVLMAGLAAWLFGDALFGSGMFVYRDAAHYYYPLLEYTSGQWSLSQAPLWNPYENLGMPTVGDATAALFYPGKLIFLLPLGFAWTYKIYIVAHVLLAAVMAYVLARRWNASTAAAGICALSYAFSGNVLFQYCNVVFLVGAAWLPLALLAAERMFSQESPRWAVVLGVALALMTLGGDPHTAYNAGLAAVGYAAWSWWCRRKTPSRGRALRDGGSSPRVTAHFLLLTLAALTAVALSAVQVFPSVETARRTTRAASSTARSLYEIPTRDNAVDGLLYRNVEEGSHHEQIYQFSVAPWRLVEYFWPNISGRQFPTHRRWLDAIPAEGNTWVPSLYMGILPLLLALSAMRFRRGRDTRRGWLSWMTVLAVLAAFGWYGMGWLAQEVAGEQLAAHVGAPVGGPYWLMTVVLPGYVYFRYPAKLLVVAALGLSLLAAQGWEETFGHSATRGTSTRRLGRWVAVVVSVSLVEIFAALAMRPRWEAWLAGAEPNQLFGPLDTGGAFTDLIGALSQTALVCWVSWWLLRRAKKQCRWVAPVALLLVAVDLGVANRWMVACAPQSQWTGPSTVAKTLDREDENHADPGPYRVYRHGAWIPPAWSATSSPTRQADAMRWDRDTLLPKYPMQAGIAMAQVETASMPSDYRAVWDVIEEDPARGAAVLDLLGVRYAVLPGEAKKGSGPFSAKHPPGRSGKRVLTPFSPEDVSLWYSPSHLPRAWIVHQVDVLAPLETDDPAAIRKRTAEVLFPEGRARNWRRSAVVETKKGSGPFSAKHPPGRSGKRVLTPFSSRTRRESCSIVGYSPGQVLLEVSLKSPGLVVLADQYDPDWTLEAIGEGEEPRPVPILRTNRVMRGAWLPAGDYQLQYRYRPASYRYGVTLSGLSWILLIGWGLWMERASRRRVRPKKIEYVSPWRDHG